MSTFKFYFEGRRDLFSGLKLGELETKWETFPVLHISFGSINALNESYILEALLAKLKGYEKDFEVEINDSIESIGERFGLLIQNIANKTGKKVVILIDEYDKGIIEVLDNPKKLQRNINLFRPFYAQLKEQERHIRFALITGVSGIHNLSLLCDATQFKDISLDPNYAASCGFTQDELEETFIEGIEELARENDCTTEETKELLRIKYKGYRFSSNPVRVYNPFSILNCFFECNFRDYWISSGGSKQVFIDCFKNSPYCIEEIECTWMKENSLLSPLNLTDPISFLFQTGYLTIKDYDKQMYLLGLPNGEVRSALIEELAPEYLGINSNLAALMTNKLDKIVREGDPEGLLKECQRILAKTPDQLFGSDMAESIYYHSIWLICQMIAVKSCSAVALTGGDIDSVIKTHKYVYVVKFKKDRSPEKALKQIDSKSFALSWIADGRKVFKIGIEYDSQKRNITHCIIHEED